MKCGNKCEQVITVWKNVKKKYIFFNYKKSVKHVKKVRQKYEQTWTKCEKSVQSVKKCEKVWKSAEKKCKKNVIKVW